MTLGAGVAAGVNAHRIVDLEQTATWLHEQTGTWFHRSRDMVQSGFETARDEIGRRIESFAGKPVSAAQASQEWTSPKPSADESLSRAIADLGSRVDQARAAGEGSARDLGQGIERLRTSAEQNQRDLVAKLAQLTERMERIERQPAVAAPAAAQPVVQQTAPSPAKAVKTVPQPAPAPKPAPKQTKIEPKPGMEAKGIPNWTVREVFDDTAVLQGPRGLIAVGPGDTIPGIGQVQAIVRSGRRWIVATTKGVITPQ